MKFHTLVTHKRPHPDEAAAFALLREYGSERFSLAEDAKIIFVDAGYANYQGRDPKELEIEGILQIGVGSGRFNEHATETLDRIKNETAATLVAKALGIGKIPEVAYVLNWVKGNDLKGQGGKFDLAHSMRVKFSDGQTDQKVLEWAIDEISTHLRSQRKIHNFAIPELAKAKFLKVNLPGKKIRIAMIRTDNEQILTAARAKKELNISILIVKRSSGNAQILPIRQDLAVDMPHVAARIRLTEAMIAKLNIDPGDRRLYNEAVIHGMTPWHFQVETGMIMNGSLTARQVVPTKIPLEVLGEMVKDGLRFANRPDVRRLSKVQLAS